MKKFSNIYSVFALLFLTLLFSCKDKENDPSPSDTDPTAQVYTVTMNTNNSTSNVEANVSTADGSAILKLDVTSVNDIDQIFIMKSMDNGDLTAVPVTTMTVGGKTFTGGSAAYSLKVPGSTKNFIIEIPITIRTSSAAVTDVYYIWITNGTGSYTQPTKNRELGPAILTLKYSASASSITYSQSTLDAGTQSALSPSFLVTSGKVSALTTAEFNEAPASADIRLVTLDASGKKNNTATNVYLYSPADIASANPPSDGSPAFVVVAGANSTVFMAYTAKSFADVTGNDLSALTFGTTKNIAIQSGQTYAFKTAAGKNGVLKVNSITADTDATNAGGYNANISIKVLN